jgi:hypothetical protein
MKGRAIKKGQEGTKNKINREQDGKKIYKKKKEDKKGKKKQKPKKKTCTMASKMEPPMPQVLIRYITNEGTSNQKRTRRNRK